MKRFYCILLLCMAFLFSLLNEENVNARTLISVEKAGSLSSLLTQEQQDTLTMLSLSGKLNSADIRTLRHMAGYMEEGCRAGRLKWLDLREVEFVTDKEPYLEIDVEKENANYQILYKFENIGSGGSLLDQSYLETFEPLHNANLKDNNKRWTQDKYSNEGTGKGVGKYFVFILNDEKDSSIRVPKSRWCVDSLENGNNSKIANLLQKGMKRKNGHEIKVVSKRHYFYSYTQKNTFCKDMFYHCPMLQLVIVPESCKIDNIVELKNMGFHIKMSRKGKKVRNPYNPTGLEFTPIKN